MIRISRKSTQRTQEDIANELGITSVYYSKIENSRIIPTDGITEKIIKLFNLDSDLYSNIIALSRIGFLSERGIDINSFKYGIQLIYGFRYVDSDGTIKFSYEKNSSKRS